MSTSPTGTRAELIDPRGLRFAAGVTSVVLALVLIFQSPWLLACQTVVFGVGAIFGASKSPYGQIFARLIRPRLAPPTELEDPQPPRFAQLIGFAFAAVGACGFFLGSPIVGSIAAGFALTAALLNSTIGFCLGCEVYLVLRRLSPVR